MAYTQSFKYGEQSRAHFEGFKELLTSDSTSEIIQYKDKKFLLTTLLILSSASDNEKIKQLLEIYYVEELNEMLDNIFSLVIETIPKIASQMSGKVDKINNLCSIMMKRSGEVLDNIRKDVIIKEALTQNEFVSIFSEDLYFLLNPQGVRNALLPYFLNRSVLGSTASSSEDILKKQKAKRVSFLLG